MRHDWEQIKEKCSFEKGELIQVSVVDEYVKGLEQQVKGLQEALALTIESKKSTVTEMQDDFDSLNKQRNSEGIDSRIEREKLRNHITALGQQLESKQKELERAIGIIEASQLFNMKRVKKILTPQSEVSDEL